MLNDNDISGLDLLKQIQEEDYRLSQEKKARIEMIAQQNRANAKIEKERREAMDEAQNREMRSQVRNIEYLCSYQELIDAVEKGFPEYTQPPPLDLVNLNYRYYYTVETLPAHWFYIDDLKEELGYGRFSIEKLYSVEPSEYQYLLEDHPRLANGASNYKPIGYITVKKIMDGDGSVLGVKTDNPDLLELFSEILTRISIPQKKMGNTVKSKNKKILRRGPNLDTREKIRNLAKNREDQISANQLIVGWVKSCEKVGINHATAKFNAPILRSKWTDRTYHWNEDQENW
jgi:hypothetical protein